MSDGPHRSLPMRRHWKELAKRLENSSYTPEEIDEAWLSALKKDFREVPLSETRAILVGNGQGSLFKENRAAQIDSVRQSCRGSVVGDTLIDCVIETDANGLTGNSALHHALTNALEAHVRTHHRQIEEHYYRKSPAKYPQVRERLHEAYTRFSRDTFASELMSNPQSNSSHLLPKRAGIDEGPQL